MIKFRFDPPVMLQSNVNVTTLDEAAAIVRSFHGARRPVLQASVLRKLEGAHTPQQQRDAGYEFRTWARAEGLMLKPEAST